MSYGTCNFCGSEDVVLIAGYRYCAICSHKLDRVFIHNAITNAFPPITLNRIQQLCTEMFGTNDYCYAEFSKLYKFLDRGGWDEKTQRFDVPCNIYVVKVFDLFLQQSHPQLFNRIKDERNIPTVW